MAEHQPLYALSVSGIRDRIQDLIEGDARWGAWLRVTVHCNLVQEGRAADSEVT